MPDQQPRFDFCQRWRAHRSLYRPAGEPIDPTRYGVEVIESDKVAGAFVREHHYAHSMPAAVLKVGLYRSASFAAPALVGVAVFSVPGQKAAIPCWLKVPNGEGVELGRFVLLDDVEANGETWFLARALRELRKAKPSTRRVLSYSDPVERVVDGVTVKPGHVGTIYRAANATQLGRSKVEYEHVTASGVVVSRRMLGKIRRDEVGAAGSYKRLLAMGAPKRSPHEPGPAYVLRAMASGAFTKRKHPGKIVYALGLDRSERQAVRGLAA